LSVKSARGVFTGIFAVVLLCFIALTIRRNGDWRDNLTLYTKTLEKAPNSARVHYNLGVIYDERGENEKALREFMETLRLDPSNMYVRLDLAAMFAQMGALKETVRLYKEAISLSPNDPEIVEAYVNLGRIYYDSGNRDEAIRLWQKALQLKPDIQIVRRWLAEAGAGS
jgi:tetratricopeptide (TPR) repeat protein